LFEIRVFYNTVISNIKETTAVCIRVINHK
jgi:hypothetical protein